VVSWLLLAALLVTLLLAAYAVVLAAAAWALLQRRRAERAPVWRLHVVRLGYPMWDAGYRRDWMARHWWLDVWRWRVALIRRRTARRWGLRLHRRQRNKGATGGTRQP
jgi:hypothetical protein